MPRILRLLPAVLLVVIVSAVPPSGTAHASTVFLHGFPNVRQQHSLTCESSAASMGTKGRLSEAQIMGTLPRNPNPNLGFRGNPDGQQGNALVDYGVYANPVHQALARYGYRSDLIMNGNDDIIASYVDRGWPVITWATYALQRAAPRISWFDGQPFFLVPHEHAILIVGYDDGNIIANDPATGLRVTYDWANFNRAWGYFDRMALAVEPCPLPQAAQNLRLAGESAAAVSWSWDRAGNASRYKVELRRVDAGNQLIYRGGRRGRTYTFLHPVPNAIYRLTVTSVSPCGSAAAPTRLDVQLPGSLPQPLPPATPKPTPKPARTAVPPPSPSPTAQPTPTP